MDTRLLYNQLLEEIHADQVSLEEKRELVRLLKKRFDREQQASGAATPAAVQVRQEPSPVTPLPKAEATGLPNNFAQLVEAALPALAGREFVVGDVASEMRKRTPSLPEKINPKITTVLRRLYDAKSLIRTFEGGGNVPHKYRLA